MAVPKKKTSKSRRDKRRANWKLDVQPTVKCSNCGNPTMSHIACPSCGNYNGREYLKALPKKQRREEASA